MDKDAAGGGAGGGGVDDMGESMQCTNHPYKTNPGGICAFCLQEKLGKLLSTSQSNPSFFPSSSSSPSFRSAVSASGGGGGVSFAFAANNSSSSSSMPSSSTSASKKKMKKVVASSSNINSSTTNNLVLVRSKSSSSSAAAIRRRHHLFDGEEYSPRKGGFWSFLHFSSRRSSREKNKGESKPAVHPTTISTSTHTPAAAAAKDKSVGGITGGESSSRRGDYGDENESPNSSHASSSSFGRKVARSRSVGCGSRSFSGDLLERISTGFGDCTLRRVESQREAKQSSKGAVVCRGGRCEVGMGIGDHHHHHHRIKERVKCGGIFGGFSSSSSSSSYWASSSEDVNHNNDSRRAVGSGHLPASVPPHGRNKSWGWAFASPMRAFKSSSKPEDKSAATGSSSASTNAGSANTPNLSAIPSLLTVRS